MVNTDPLPPFYEEHKLLARAAASESIVLLKNDGLLPMRPKRLALYGTGARKTIKGGTGSGDVSCYEVSTVEQGLENAGFAITTKNWLDRFDRLFDQAYESWLAELRKRLRFASVWQSFLVKGENPFRYPSGCTILGTDISDSGTDTAMYVLSRQSGEGRDRAPEKGDYYLTDIEIEHLWLLSKAYEKLILVINTGSQIDLSCLDEIPGINAVIYMGQAGMESGNALADLITGQVTPSGKLTDTWPVRYEDIPFSQEYSNLNGNVTDEDYREDIYVGYRYFDTFDIRPRYEFGFGLSYTSFSVSADRVEMKKDRICCTVSVTNTGSRQGKETVQAYVSCPAGRLNKEAKRLTAFSKTRCLDPGETEKLELEFSLRDCASYDTVSSAWILEAGEYTIYIGVSSRKIQAVAAVQLKQTSLTRQCVPICPLAREMDILTTPVQSKMTAPENCVRLCVESIDQEKNIPVREAQENTPNVDTLTVEELSSLVVGYGHVRALTANPPPGACGLTTPALRNKGVDMLVLADGPAGLRLLPEYKREPSGKTRYPAFSKEDASLSLFYRFVNMVTKSHHPCAKTEYQYATAWPTEALLAQSWNPAILEEMGRCVSREMEYFGVHIWLAPGMNIHRNPLCGRNFEYYSEDPFISGTMAAALTRGVQSNPHCSVTIKHFACNNQEENREHVSSNVTERALREIYLKGFEIAVKTAAPDAVMTSYNRINGEYTANSRDLCTSVLREEWGFRGLVMSDWESVKDGQAELVRCFSAGNDLIMPGDANIEKQVVQAAKDGRISSSDLSRSAQRIINLSVKMHQ